MVGLDSPATLPRSDAVFASSYFWQCVSSIEILVQALAATPFVTARRAPRCSVGTDLRLAHPLHVALSAAPDGLTCGVFRKIILREVFKWKAKFCGALPPPAWRGPLSQPLVSTRPALPRHRPLKPTKPKPCMCRTTPASRQNPGRHQSAHWGRTRPCRFGRVPGDLTIDLNTLPGRRNLDSRRTLMRYIFDSYQHPRAKG